MKRASYREAIEWIALNDSAADDQAEAERNASEYTFRACSSPTFSGSK